MPEILGLVLKARNVRAGDGLQRSTVTLVKATVDGEPFDGELDLSSPPVAAEQAYATMQRLRQASLVIVEATPTPDRSTWVLEGVLASELTQDPRLDHVANTVSPARHPSDIAQRTDRLVPDIFRVEPLDLPGVGLAWAEYRMENELRFTTSGWRTEGVDQQVFDIEGLRMHLWTDADLVGAARALQNFCAAGPELRDAIAPHVLAFYNDVKIEFGDEPGFPVIGSPEAVWEHVSHNHAEVSHTIHDGVNYLIFEAECRWEEEHGLQMAFADGERICRVSTYDGHPLNRDPSVIFEPTFGS